ncbi:YadA C-terminal domain-containing protein [Fusobacterium necrophorum]|uniref:YadA C-terminal domain-containing protein n=1 Tax=Fusobacterium necrophorum TaxID=859 RepID=UPI0021C2DB29|nr:YadA C-terminal domain-containing protein [Fusobacterium necrophorum]
MKNNLEKLVKGCFKGKFSMSLAVLTIFAITGNVGYGYVIPGYGSFIPWSEHVWEDFVVYGTTYVKDLNVHGNSTVHKSLTVRGNSTVQENLTVRKNFDVDGNSFIGGNSIVEGASFIVKDSYVGGNFDVGGNSTVRGNSTVQENLTVGKNATVKGNLSVKGKLTIDGVDVKEKLKTTEEAIIAESERRALADTQLAYEIGTNRGNINKLEKEVEARREADERQDKAIAANSSAIKHLDRKVNKGTAMTVAMSNVDFQNVNTGEVAIGAGIGHYVGDQAVAVGIAYGVNEDLKVHAKWSGVAGDPHYNAIGGGVTYKFKTR